MKCINELHALWCRIECSVKKNENNATWFHFLAELLLLLVQQKTPILSDKKFLPTLFASTLGSSSHNILVPQNMEYGFDQPTKERILEFILGSALKFSNYGKLMILSLLKGVGYAIMHPNIAPVLTHSMEKYYHNHKKSSQKFPNTRTQIMCLLLKSCVMSSPSDGVDLQDPLLKTLQLDDMTSDDPSYVEPCIFVLNKLNSQFYTGLQNKVKEDLFCALVFLCRSANSDVQSATKEALMQIYINFLTVFHIINLIFAPKCGTVRSADEKTKKRQKFTRNQEARTHNTTSFFNTEKSLTFSSSFGYHTRHQVIDSRQSSARMLLRTGKDSSETFIIENPSESSVKPNTETGPQLKTPITLPSKWKLSNLKDIPMLSSSGKRLNVGDSGLCSPISSNAVRKSSLYIDVVGLFTSTSNMRSHHGHFITNNVDGNQYCISSLAQTTKSYQVVNDVQPNNLERVTLDSL
ncbi:hypothetical protein RYX36_029400, partial [Vicia faba]